MTQYDKIARYYDVVFGEVYPYDAEVKMLHRLFQKYGAGRVLDVTCGTGNHLVRLAALGYECAGSDISSGMVAMAKAKAGKKGFKIDFYQNDVKQLTIPRTFDAVISLYGLPFTLLPECVNPSLQVMLEGFRKALRGIYRVLEPGGIFIFNMMNPAATIQSPGYGPWSESNVHGKQVNKTKIVLMNKIQRSGNLLNFKDIYLVQDREVSLEVLRYRAFLLSLEQVKPILTATGFRVEAVYSNLATLSEFGGESLDMTIVSSREIMN
ncbi:MAG TPA: class I SAM-dependent methyltransferase [Candidatus Deferrimicrobium sp.]|nr:class I SAM-dependent methyltransferase [Candidatus Deferrimicrobium sp.]